jgi:tetratricopeptide (TPR) repeat protein
MRWSVAAMLCVALSSSFAWGQTENTASTAAQFFRAGLAAYDRHEYRAAALAFEEAYRRAPRGPAIYNAGRGWEAAGDKARAADAFATAIAGGEIDAHDAQYASEHLAALEPSLAIVELSGPATSTAFVDGTERGALPRMVHVEGGGHDVRVSRRFGAAVEQHVSLAAGGSVRIVVEDVQPPPEAPRFVPPQPMPGPPRAPPSTARRTWGFIAFGGAAVLGGVSAVTYSEFLSHRSSFNASGDHDSSLHDSALRYRAATYALWATAGAAAAAGTILVLTYTSGTGTSMGALRAGPGWAEAALRF